LTPVFFTDRDLGNLFPEQLITAGIRVERHSDHFAPDATDEDWLTRVGRHGWFCLTHDRRIRYKPNQIDAVMRGGVGLFVLIGNATHSELADNFVRTIHKVKQFIKKYKRPFIAKIRSHRNPRSLSGNKPGDVKLWLSYNEWQSQNIKKRL